MIYTYYSGFRCVGINKATGKQCGAFIGVEEYKTHVHMGLRNVTGDAPANCNVCGLRYAYSPEELVYSLRSDEIVPLDHEPQ